MLGKIVSLLTLLPLILCDIGSQDGSDDYLHYAIYNQSEVHVIRSLNKDYKRGTRAFRDFLESKLINGYTPLMSAISSDKISIAKILVKAGANVNARDKFMESPLHHAARRQDQENAVLNLVRMMLMMGANINAVCDSGFTPFLLACKEGKEYLAMEFLRRGAKVHNKDEDYRTALYHAASRGWESVVGELFQKRAKIDISGWIENPLQCAIQNGHRDIAHFMLLRAASIEVGLESKNVDEDTTLIMAVKNGMVNCAHELLKMGVDPNGKGRQSNTAAHWAASAGEHGLLDSLLRRGCDPNVTNIFGQSPLDFAIVKMISNPAMNSRSLKESLVFTLIEAGVDVRDENSQQLLKHFYLSHRDLDEFDIPFDDFITKVSNNHGRTRKYNVSFVSLVEDYEGARNFALYRLLKLRLLKRGIKYVSDLESFKFSIYDELMYEITKKTYMEKLPLELVSDAFINTGGYYTWKMERLAWNAALASRYLKADLKEANTVAMRLWKNFK